MQFGGLEQGDSEELEKNIYSQILDFFQKTLQAAEFRKRKETKKDSFLVAEKALGLVEEKLDYKEWYEDFLELDEQLKKIKEEDNDLMINEIKFGLISSVTRKLLIYLNKEKEN